MRLSYELWDARTFLRRKLAAINPETFGVDEEDRDEQAIVQSKVLSNISGTFDLRLASDVHLVCVMSIKAFPSDKRGARRSYQSCYSPSNS
jgi:hypothetical protein